MRILLIKKIAVVLLLLAGFSHSCFPDMLSEHMLYRFEGNWLRYDKYYESYLPLKGKELKSERSIHQVIPYEKYKNYELKFEAMKGLTLFVNHKLVYKKIEGDKDTVQIPFNTFQADEAGNVIFTFFHPRKILPVRSASIVYRSDFNTLTKTGKSESTFLHKRENINDLSGYALLFLTIVTLFVGFKQVYPKEYIRYYSLATQENSDHLMPGSFSIPSLWMAFINGMVLSLLIYMLRLDDLIFATSYPLIKGTIFIIVAYFGFYVGKYVYLWLIAWLFNYSKVVPPQFAEYIRFFERVCLLVAVSVFGIFAAGILKWDIKPDVLYYVLIIVLILAFVKVIFLFFRLISHRSLYLFSYLCAAEVLPLVIAVKILLF